jgi:GT2 family glycosyltransferase
MNGGKASLTELSIMILNYNGLEYIDQCVKSFLKTSDTDFEIIIIDNKSTDGSVEYLAEARQTFPNLRVVLLDSNYGYGGGFMNGMKIARPRGCYLAFSNADLVVDPNWFMEIRPAFRRRRVGVAGPVQCDYTSRDQIQVAGAYLVNKHILTLQTIFAFNQSYMEYKHQNTRPYDTFFPGAALFVTRADAFLRIGGFDSSLFAYGEEFDLGLRTWLSGSRAMVAPKSRVYHKGGGSKSDKSMLLRRLETMYLSHRNIIRSLIKCIPWKGVISVIPLSFLHLLTHATIQALVLKEPRFVLSWGRAVFWNLRNLQDTLRLKHFLTNRLEFDLNNLEPIVVREGIHEIHGIVKASIAMRLLLIISGTVISHDCL